MTEAGGPGPPPAPGRDSRGVPTELGYPPAEITRLRDAGVAVAP
jgi:hypothetical protein